MESMFQKIMPSATGTEAEDAPPLGEAPTAIDKLTKAALDSAIPMVSGEADAALTPALPIPDAAQAPVADADMPEAATALGDAQDDASNPPALLGQDLLDAVTQLTGDLSIPAAAAPSGQTKKQTAAVNAATGASTPAGDSTAALPIAAPVHPATAAPTDTSIIPATLIAPVAPATPNAPEATPVQPSPPDEPVLINLARPFLESRLDAALGKFQCCTCEKCRMDVLAVALNKVAPQYAALPKGAEPLGYVTSEFAREAVTGLVQSIFQIKSHPRH